VEFKLWYAFAFVGILLNFAVSIYILRIKELERFQRVTQIVLIWLIPFIASIGLWVFNRSLEQEAKQDKEFGSGPQDTGFDNGE